MQRTGIPVLIALLASGMWAPAGRAEDRVVLDDALEGATTGTRSGGEFADSGWKVTAFADSIIWHIPTVRRGAAEFSVKGLQPKECRPGMGGKNELFHMYDWASGNADRVYAPPGGGVGGYRNNPFKHFIRKTNCLDTRPGKTDSLELLLKIHDHHDEPDSPPLDWNPEKTYRFRVEWGPDGAGNCEMKVSRDGVVAYTMRQPGEWAPEGHSVRIGASNRRAKDEEAPLDAVFSGVKVWDLGAAADPAAGAPGGAAAAPAADSASPSPSPAVPPKLGVDGDMFTINGRPAFLLGVSYFDGRSWRASDLDVLAARRFNLIRIWLDWADRGFFDADGNLAHAQALLDLVRACRARGIVVDVTILDPLPTFKEANGEKAVRAAVSALKDEPNVFYDVMNEHDHPSGPIPHSAVAALIRAARGADAKAIVAVSGCGGHIDGDEGSPRGALDEELAAGIQFAAPHFGRERDWAARTGPRVSRLRAYLAGKGKPMPVYLQEEARRGHSGLKPPKDDFIRAAVEARNAGAAAWLFHTGAGFNLHQTPFFDALDAEERAAVDALGQAVFGGAQLPIPKAGQ